MTRRLGAAAAAFLIAVLAAAPALAAEVTLSDTGFSPAEVTVAPGDTIVWTNTSRTEHTVVADDGTWDSGPLSTGDTFSITLRREGTYSYSTEDGTHTGVVVVAAAQPDEPGEDEVDADADDPDAEPAAAPATPRPVTPRTGLPVSLLAAIAAGLLLAGGVLVSRR